MEQKNEKNLGNVISNVLEDLKRQRLKMDSLIENLGEFVKSEETEDYEVKPQQENKELKERLTRVTAQINSKICEQLKKQRRDVNDFLKSVCECIKKPESLESGCSIMLFGMDGNAPKSKPEKNESEPEEKAAEKEENTLDGINHFMLDLRLARRRIYHAYKFDHCPYEKEDCVKLIIAPNHHICAI